MNLDRFLLKSASRFSPSLRFGSMLSLWKSFPNWSELFPNYFPLISDCFRIFRISETKLLWSSALVIAWRVLQCVRSVIRSQLEKSWELLPSLSPLPNSPSVSAAAEKNCKAPKSRHAILFADSFNRNLSANWNPLFLWLPATPLATKLRLDWRGLRVLCGCLPSFSAK